MVASRTALAKLGIGAADPVDTALNFSGFDPGVTRELRDSNGTRGTFFKDGNRMTENRVVVTPTFSSEPTSAEWHTILAWAMAAPTGTTTKTYPFSDDTTERYVHFKPNAGEEWFLTGVAVDTFNLRAASGEALTCDLGLCGRIPSVAHATLPALTYDITLKPFILSQLVLTVDGVERKCRSFAAGVNYQIDKTRFLNSLYLTANYKLGTMVTFACEVPSGDNSGLWDQGIDGCSATAVFTNPGTSKILSLTWPDLRFPARSPNHPPNAEGFLTIEAEAMRVGQASTDYPIQITLTA